MSGFVGVLLELFSLMRNWLHNGLHALHGKEFSLSGLLLPFRRSIGVFFTAKIPSLLLFLALALGLGLALALDKGWSATNLLLVKLKESHEGELSEKKRDRYGRDCLKWSADGDSKGTKCTNLVFWFESFHSESVRYLITC